MTGESGRVLRRLAAVYGVIAVFVASERFLRQGAAARALQESPEDRGSTRAVGAALGLSTLSLALAPLLNRYRVAALPQSPALFRTGIAAMMCGLLLRVWATRVLGASYTRTLRVELDQHIVEGGPYRVVRHPGYLGTLLVWLGGALALGNTLVFAGTGVVLLRAYMRRIEAEERMLLASFDAEYRAYAQRTKRLVPFLL